MNEINTVSIKEELITEKNKFSHHRKRHSKKHIIKARKKHIDRKIRILQNLHGKENFSFWYRNVHKGAFSKGKIHCSCYLCRPYKHTKSPTVSTKRKIEQ